MEDISWLQMLAYQQSLHHFFRFALPQGQKQRLRTSELELLSRIYLRKEESTPLELSRQSGMKKEAVSRCLKQLQAKGFIEKNRRPQDERSYALTLTESGREALRSSYRPMLQPMYELQRKMGDEFTDLFRLIQQANSLIPK